MQHRRKGRRTLLPIGAAVVATTVAAVGGLLITVRGVGGTGESQDRPSATPAVARIDCVKKGQLPGSGSTAQQNAMEHWIKEYQRACPGAQVAYNPVGSGAGVNQFLREAKAFGGTDGALKPDEVERSRDICRGGRGIDLPMLGGPIAIGYNLSGVDDLVLDAPTLARIFDSEIKEWDDPAIRELNPGTDLPDLPIQAVHRSDDSGTTQNFMAYLSGAAPEQWPYEGSKTWQGKGGHSADGSDNVASEVSSDHGAIGYFELSFATSLDIPTVEVDTGAPEPVAPSPKTASAGIATAQVVGKGKDLSLELDYSTTKSGAYPIVLVTYEVVCDKGNPAATLAVLKSFLTYTAGDEGQEILPSIQYAPLPEAIASRVRAVVGTLS
ncbi:phosphate ABC transporter substrate-binding protein PstS [Streptomyces phaeochromogenes]|uniref:phosphate ABC transporter substrate-binding protein PstS n=1 Tax=Streptomyces phaeochromogenes TaxID=1923 RepID=UPI002DD9ED64|nr:phosphate ABC transporter substrate-binding protein PstS [Streptomyces phaeochromogenes]WRZ28761.1 phosphate ABC transporter substrate-binding protein PstS [Streptomyces phaeochromogenes]